MQHHRSGPHRRRLQTDSALFLGGGFTAEGAGDRGVVRLLEARIGGQLRADGCIESSTTNRRHLWDIDGLTYSGVPRLTWNGDREPWLELLRTGTPRYAAQPYQQLAAAYRAEGHDSDARAVLMAQRKDQIARGGLSWPDRWWARLTGVLLGYGYQPWRALLYLAGVLARTTSPVTASAAPASITIPATTPYTR